jgi:hypothetical protein
LTAHSLAHVHPLSHVLTVVASSLLWYACLRSDCSAVGVLAWLQFLKRLLLVHGRWNYNRMAIIVCYMFYKNIIFVLTQYWYQIYTGWSGQKFTVELAAQTYNLVRGPLITVLVAPASSLLDLLNVWHCTVVVVAAAFACS